MSQPQPIAAHFVSGFSGTSQNWVYDQVRVHRRMFPVIVGKHIHHPEAVPFARTYSMRPAPWIRRIQQAVAYKACGYHPYFLRVLRNEGPAVLHAHFGPMGAQAVPLARRLGCPLVTSFYGTDLSTHPRGRVGLIECYAELFEHGSLFLAEGPVAAGRLIDIGCDKSRIAIHRLGVFAEEIPFLPRRRELHEPLRVLMASRLVEKKGTIYAIEAFARLASRGVPVRLTIVGDARPTLPAERQLKDRILAILDAAGVSHLVDFAGFLSRQQLRQLSLTHHVFLHPSVTSASGDTEGGHPVVITELAATGMAVISSLHADIPEVVEHGTTGWLCAERDVGALEAALEQAFQDPEDLLRRGVAGRALVQRKYPLGSNTLDDLYRDRLSVVA